MRKSQRSLKKKFNRAEVWQKFSASTPTSFDRMCHSISRYLIATGVIFSLLMLIVSIVSIVAWLFHALWTPGVITASVAILLLAVLKLTR
jgi:hypothetical protein